MQDFDGNDLQVGDTVVFYTQGSLRRGGGMRKGVIINIRPAFKNPVHGTAQIAQTNTADEPLTDLNHESIYRISTDYRGANLGHLRELFPYREKEVDDSYPSW